MPQGEFYRHGLQRLHGRDIRERHRPSSPLELFYDLTFVATIGVASVAFADGIAAGKAGPAAGAFGVTMFAILWAWAGSAWFASAFEVDDWLFRIMTMAQMAGVIVLGIGVPDTFQAFETGTRFAPGVMTAGYVIIRIATIGQWVRVAGSDPPNRSLAIGNAVVVGVAQCGWVAQLFLPLPTPLLLLWVLVFLTVEIAGPLVVERRATRGGRLGVPWHPEHIAERYGLMAIITLGETVTGTLASAARISAARGWSLDAVVVIATGVVISFSLWWAYYLIPSAPVLAVRRDKFVVWVYGHIVLFAAIAAVGAGLHVIGFTYEPRSHVTVQTAVVSVAGAVLLVMLCMILLDAWLVSALLSTVGYAFTLAPPVAAIGLAFAGWPLWACLLVVAASPLSIIITYESRDWRGMRERLQRVLETNTPDRNDSRRGPDAAI